MPNVFYLMPAIAPTPTQVKMIPTTKRTMRAKSMKAHTFTIVTVLVMRERGTLAPKTAGAPLPARAEPEGPNAITIAAMIQAKLRA